MGRRQNSRLTCGGNQRDLKISQLTDGGRAPSYDSMH